MDKDTTRAGKLTAIMFIDMVGYTAMMQKNEKKTQIDIQHQRDIIVPIVESYGGEVLRYIFPRGIIATTFRPGYCPIATWWRCR